MTFWTLLGSHRLAVVLMLAVAVTATLGGTLPQSMRFSPDELRDWQAGWGWLRGALATLRFSDVYGSFWFWGLCAMLLLNLAVGMLQFVLRRPAWSRPHVWGVLVGHGGLLMLVAGGMASALTSFGAHLELAQGEVWYGTPDKLSRDRGRAEPLDVALRLDRIAAAVAVGSHLRELRLGLTWQVGGGLPQQGETVANRPLDVAGHRVHPDNTFGHAAVFERQLPDGERRLLLVNFPLSRADWGKPRWTAERRQSLETRGKIRHYRFYLEGDPVRLNMAVTHGPKTLFDGWLTPGDSVVVDGEQMRLREVRPWAGLYLARDRGVAWAFAGMALAIGGFFVALAWPRSSSTAGAR